MAITISGTTGIAGVDGSAGTPAVQGTDTNTGTFFPAADTVAWTTGGSERMRVDSSGNVGIGTSSPSKKLDVNGSINANSIEVGLNGESIKKASGSLYIETGSANPLIFTTNSAERIRIDSSGNLLVGCTSAPSTSVAGSGFVVESVGRKSLYLASNYTGATTDLIYLINPNGTQGKAGTNSTGSYWSTSSDYRLKENIQPMQNALNKVALLKPCTYTWKSTGESGQGFIAHELQEIVPEAVIGEKDAVDADGNPDYQGIDTSFLVATLTAAIQEQQALIQALTDRITALEAK